MTSSRDTFPLRILPASFARRRIVTLFVPLCRYPSVRTPYHWVSGGAEEFAGPREGPRGQAASLVITTWVDEPAIRLTRLVAEERNSMTPPEEV